MFKFVIAASLYIFSALAARASDDCPVDREVKCVDEFKEALPFCKKA